MTRRTRTFLSVAAAILLAGVGTGLVASYMGFSGLSAISGSSMAELEFVPAGAQAVAFVDVGELMASDLHQRFNRLGANAPANDLKEQTGLDLQHDIDHVVAAVLAVPNRGTSEPPLMLVRGRFDQVRIEGVIRQRGGRVETYRDTRLFILASGDQPMAVAFAEPDLAVVGTVPHVRQALDTKAEGRNITTNASLMTMMKKVDDGTAWAVGTSDAIANDTRLPGDITRQLPPIRAFAASAQVSSELAAQVHAETPDAASAQNLRDVIRGFVALGRLQTSNNPQLAGVLDSLQLGGAGTDVSVSFAVPMALLDRIAPRPPDTSRP